MLNAFPAFATVTSTWLFRTQSSGNVKMGDCFLFVFVFNAALFGKYVLSTSFS